jgi:hypothetical protein
VCVCVCVCVCVRVVMVVGSSLLHFGGVWWCGGVCAKPSQKVAKAKSYSKAGNRTRVSCVTGKNTNHYTTSEGLVKRVSQGSIV